MSVRRLLAIGCIFAAAAGGWWILGGATAVRSSEFGSRLGEEVQRLWGVPLVQQAPSLSVEIPGSERVRWIMPAENKVRVALQADHRKKGLMWYPTYTCAFDGTYVVSNPEEVTQKVRMHFDFPAKGGTYDEFALYVNDEKVMCPVDTREGVGEIAELGPGERAAFRITYKTRGMREWRYGMDPRVARVQNLDLAVDTGFRDVDYPDGCRSPVSSEATDNGMRLTWQATDLITKQDIGITIPEKLNPGPLTSRITFFAPVCLLFFFVLRRNHANLAQGQYPPHALLVRGGRLLRVSFATGLHGGDCQHPCRFCDIRASVRRTCDELSVRGPSWSIPLEVGRCGPGVLPRVVLLHTFFLKGITGLSVAIGSVVTLAVLMKADRAGRVG